MCGKIYFDFKFSLDIRGLLLKDRLYTKELGITILLIYLNIRWLILGNRCNYQIVITKGFEKGLDILNLSYFYLFIFIFYLVTNQTFMKIAQFKKSSKIVLLCRN